jgi:hypothetical protein
MIVSDELGTILYLVQMITYDGRSILKSFTEQEFDVFLDSTDLQKKFRSVKIKPIHLR